jgi:hypothetical protein
MRYTTLLLAATLLTGCFTAGMAEGYIDRNPAMTTKERQAVRGGWIYVGMPARHAAYALGAPDRVNTTTTERGQRKQWVFAGARGTAYVYVRGGTVRSIQENGYEVTAP